MKKRILCMLLCVLTVLSLIPFYASAEGEVWHEIYTVEDLYAINNDLAGNYKLMNDIDLTEATAPGGDYDFMGNGWDPIGSGHIYSNATPFSGVFDGNGYAINGMRIDVKQVPDLTVVENGSMHVGFFASVSGTVRNLSINGSMNVGSDSIVLHLHYTVCAGTIAGSVSGTIDNCHSDTIITAKIEAGNVSVGGIAGQSSGGIISNSSSSSDISNEKTNVSTINYYGNECGEFAGIVGTSNNSTISFCYNKGNIHGLEYQTGNYHYNSGASSWWSYYNFYLNISGISNGSASINDCFNIGDISITDNNTRNDTKHGKCAGISIWPTSLNNSYNIGHVTSNISNISGCYAVSDRTSTFCYYLSGTGVQSAGTTELSSALLKRENSFNGFDFENIWTIIEDSSYVYPQLRNNIYDGESIVSSIAIAVKPTKLTFLEGKDSLNTANGKITIFYKDETTTEKIIERDMVTGFDNTKIGSQTLTVRFGRHTATYDITIIPKSLSGISVSQLPTKIKYIEGLESLDLAGGKLSLLYDNDTIEEIDLSTVQVTGFDNTKVGVQTLTASFNGFTATFQIEIIAKSVASIEVYKLPDKLTYLEAKDTLDVTGGKVKLNYNNGTSDIIDMTADMVSGFNNTLVGPQTLTVSYEGKTATFEIVIEAKSISSITMSSLPNKLSYIENYEELDISGGKVKLNYNNGTSDVIDLTEDMVVGFDNSTVGKCTIDVYYEGVMTSFDVNIIARSVTDIEMARFPDNLIYLEGRDALDTTGGKIRVYYNDNTEEEIDLTPAMVSGFSNSSVGVRTLTVTYQGKTTTFEVEIIEKTLIGIEIADLPAKLTFIEGKDYLSVTGGRIRLLYDNGTSMVTSMTTDMVYGFNNTYVGKQTLTVNYWGFTTEYEIEILAKSVLSIYFESKPTKLTYIEGKESLDVSGGLLHVNYNNGTTATVDVTPDMVSGFDNTVVGTQTLSVSYGGKSATYKIDVVHDYVKTVVAPTCTDSGYTEYKCAACGDRYVTDRVSALGHSFTKYVSDGNATCTADGTKTAKCDRCDATDTVADVGSALGHTAGDWEIVKEPEEGVKGIRVKKCIRCKIELEREEFDKPAFENPFIDVPDDAWFTNGALYCYAHGYMSGTSANTFSPNMNFSRAMFVTVLAKIDGADLSSYTDTHFDDVPSGNWYSKAVKWAYQNSYASGTGNGKFSPDAAVTRETLAQFFYNYSSKKGYDVSNLADLGSFGDASSVAGWALNGVKWAVANGLISGTSASTLSPKATASRAQVALIVMNYVEKFTAK